MTFKEFAILHLRAYFVLVTLIFAASTIIGVIFTPEREIYYYQLVSPFIMAALCLLPTFVTFFHDEPTLSEYIFRHIIQLGIIEGIVLYMITPPDDVSTLMFRVILALTVFVIYALAKMTVWLQKYNQSKELTRQLKKLQASE